MTVSTLIRATSAAAHLDDPGWVFVDCRFTLGQPDAGRTAYRTEHLPGAVYADLDRDLSGPITPGRTGRHPLPAPDALVATLSRLGIDAGTQVVTYDERTGGMAAARLWWLLRWAGHDAVAVLDGGLAAWRDAGLPTSAEPVEPTPRTFTPRFRDGLTATADDLLRALGTDRYLLLDARAADRYRGENETVDPVAGHIPGAASTPYTENLTPDGTFRDPADLRAQFAAATPAAPADPGVDPAPADRTVTYCGSGVTAAHTVLAYAHAGLGLPRLYAGSWSEWITDPARPVATG
jgi:thiosulfate/3-mercaptopyruvate sulfurtransferase